MKENSFLFLSSAEPQNQQIISNSTTLKIRNIHFTKNSITMVSAYFKKNFNSKHHFQLDAFISFYTSFQYLKINLMQPPPVPYLKQISQQCVNIQFLMQNFVLFYFSFRWVFFSSPPRCFYLDKRATVSYCRNRVMAIFIEQSLI